MPLITSIKELPKYVNKIVTVSGEVTDEPNTHLIVDVPTAPVANYFNMNDGQVVLYADEELPKKRLIVMARVIKASGIGKGEPVTEYQLVLAKLAGLPNDQ